MSAYFHPKSHPARTLLRCGRNVGDAAENQPDNSSRTVILRQTESKLRTSCSSPGFPVSANLHLNSSVYYFLYKRGRLCQLT